MAARHGSRPDLAAIQDLLSEIEQRLGRLNSAAKQEAAGDLNAYVQAALAEISGKLRDGAQSLTDSMADQATRLGGDALRKLEREIERHPLATVALAAGMGFLVGLVGDESEPAQSSR